MATKRIEAVDYLIPLACVSLLAVLVLYIGYPLFATRLPARSPTTSAASARDLLERKEQLFAGIKELEFDRNTGKLAEEDYRQLRAELEAEALGVLRELDQLNGEVDSATLQSRIEADVRDLRQTTAAAGPDRCPSCEAPHQTRARFCSQCGQRFAETG